MHLSAKHYLQREDAARAGRQAGSAYALVILVALALLCWAEAIGGGWELLITGALVSLGLRVGMEMWMSRKWDHYHGKRQQLMSEGVDSQNAFEAVRNMD